MACNDMIYTKMYDCMIGKSPVDTLSRSTSSDLVDSAPRRRRGATVAIDAQPSGDCSFQFYIYICLYI